MSYKYYSTQRPVDIGTYPKDFANKPIEIKNFDERIYVELENDSFRAWGYLIYNQPLTQKQIDDYELKPSYESPDEFGGENYD